MRVILASFSCIPAWQAAPPPTSTGLSTSDVEPRGEASRVDGALFASCHIELSTFAGLPGTASTARGVDGPPENAVVRGIFALLQWSSESRHDSAFTPRHAERHPRLHMHAVRAPSLSLCLTATKGVCRPTRPPKADTRGGLLARRLSSSSRLWMRAY